MQLHNIQKNKSNRKSQRVGRGSTRGKTSGRGHKGQKSRAGHRIRPAERDMIKRLPKLRGHGVNRSRTVNPSKVRPEGVNVGALENAFSAGAVVTPKDLVAKKLVRARSGRIPKVKVLGMGTLTKKLIVTDCETSKKAKELIEKAGGEVR